MDPLLSAAVEFRPRRPRPDTAPVAAPPAFLMKDRSIGILTLENLSRAKETSNCARVSPMSARRASDLFGFLRRRGAQGRGWFAVLIRRELHHSYFKSILPMWSRGLKPKASRRLKPSVLSAASARCDDREAVRDARQTSGRRPVGGYMSGMRAGIFARGGTDIVAPIANPRSRTTSSRSRRTIAAPNPTDAAVPVSATPKST